MDLFYILAPLAAFTCAFLMFAITLPLLKQAGHSEFGLIQYYPYLILFASAVSVLLSTRNYLPDGELIVDSALPNPVVGWVTKIASAYVMLAALDQIVRFFKHHGKLYRERTILLVTFIAMWLSNTLLPSYFSSHKVPLQISWLYSLILGTGLILSNPIKPKILISHFRNSLLIFCTISLLLIPIRPDLILEVGYKQGYIPGLPRLVGLTPHAILMGVLASLALFCIYTSPFKFKIINWLAFTVSVFTLFMAQSKNVWIAFILLFPILIYYRNNSHDDIYKNIKNKYRPFVVNSILICITILISICLMLLGGGFEKSIDSLFDAKQISQLTTLTGRDQIWQVALAEWKKAPWFGYGLGIFGAEHQILIRMPFATSGHNQIIDGLGRVGTIGLSLGVLHYLVFLYIGFRYRIETHGLSLVLALSLAIRMITEVPVTLMIIGIDTLPYYLLLGILGKQMKYGVKREGT